MTVDQRNDGLGDEYRAQRVATVVPHKLDLPDWAISNKRVWELSEQCKSRPRFDTNPMSALLLLGHSKLDSTVRYVGLEIDDALALSEQIDV